MVPEQRRRHYLPLDVVKTCVEEHLWQGTGNLLWSFCYQEAGKDAPERVGYAVRSAKPGTELTLVASGLYRLIDPEYQPILLDGQDPWPGYRSQNKLHGVDIDAWRRVVRANSICSEWFERLYADFLVGAAQVYKGIADGETVPVLPWIQSPVDTLSALYTPWHFLGALTDEPARVEQELEFVAEFTIAFIQFLQDWFPLASSYGFETELWMPQGVALFEDQIDIFSRFLPKGYYERFVLPPNQRIADVFGGVGLHSCGEMTDHVLEPLERFDGLIALQYDAAQTPNRRVLDALGHRHVMLVPRYSFAGIDKENRAETHAATPVGYLQTVLDEWFASPNTASMFLTVPQVVNSLLSPHPNCHVHPHDPHGVEVVDWQSDDLDAILAVLEDVELPG